MRSPALLLACALMAGAATHAQPYPAKPIRLIVGIAPGGGLDASTRIVANGLSKVVGQPIVVENRPGELSVAPDWASLADTIPGFDMPSTQFILAPALTPQAIVDRLSDSIRTVLSQEETRTAFARQGSVPGHVPPEVLAARIREGVVTWAAIAKQSGARPAR